MPDQAPHGVAFRVTPSQYRAGTALAKLQGTTLSALMRRLLDAEIERCVRESSPENRTFMAEVR